MLSSLILRNNNEPFLSWTVMCDENWTYLANSGNQFSGWAKKRFQTTFQSQTCTKKMLRSLFGGLIHPSFLNPGETIISEMYVQQMDAMH